MRHYGLLPLLAELKIRNTNIYMININKYKSFLRRDRDAQFLYYFGSTSIYINADPWIFHIVGDFLHTPYSKQQTGVIHTIFADSTRSVL